MKITKTLSVLAALALVAIVAAPVAQAVCPLNYQITVYPYPGEYSYIYTPGICDSGYPCPGGGSSMTPATKGTFWIIGDGDPAIGLGNDNGTLPAVVPSYPGAYTYGFVKLYAGYPALLVTDWNQPGIDGCAIDAVPSGARCMAMLLTDQDAAGNGYYLMRTIAANANNNYYFNVDGGHLHLAPIARPAVVGSDRNGTTVSLTLAAPDLGGGLVLDPTCNDPIVGYRILSQTVPRGAQPPSSRDIADWSSLSPSPVPVSSQTSVDVNCATDQDVYVTTAVEFDSGFQSHVVSMNSSRVECGPNLADPVNQRPRIRPGGSIELRDRGGKGDR